MAGHLREVHGHEAATRANEMEFERRKKEKIRKIEEREKEERKRRAMEEKEEMRGESGGEEAQVEVKGHPRLLRWGLRVKERMKYVIGIFA